MSCLQNCDNPSQPKNPEGLGVFVGQTAEADFGWIWLMLSLKYERVDYFGELQCMRAHTRPVCPRSCACCCAPPVLDFPGNSPKII